MAVVALLLVGCASARRASARGSVGASGCSKRQPVPVGVLVQVAALDD